MLSLVASSLAVSSLVISSRPGWVLHRPAVASLGPQLALQSGDIARIHEEADSFFDAIDENGDGSISKKELRSHLIVSRSAVHPISDAVSHARISGEPATLLPPPPTRLLPCSIQVRAGFPDAAVDTIFGLLDVNSDGEISREELRDTLVRYEDPSVKAAALNEVMETVHEQRAQAMSEEDVARIHSEADAFFDAIDENDDGTISLTEVRP